MRMEPIPHMDDPASDLERLCRPTFEHAFLPTAAVEGPGHVVRYVNPAFCRLFGKTREELIGIPFAEAVPSGGETCLPHLDRVRRTGEPEEITGKERSPVHPARSYAMWPVLGASTRPAGVMVQVTDADDAARLRKRAAVMNQELLLSAVRQHELVEAAERLSAQLLAEIAERKHAEAVLAESEERYRRIIETAAEGIWVTDANDVTVFVNPVMEDLLGHAPAAMVGRSLFAFIDREDREYSRVLQARRRRGIRERYDFRWKRKDGSMLWTAVSGSPFFDKQGKYVGTLQMISDITERKALEEQMRNAQRMEAVGRLAGGVAHDFNNMMAVVTGYASILLARIPEGHPMRRELEMIKASGERSAALTHQLLAFSRRQMLQAEVLDLDAVAGRMHRRLARLLGEDIELTIAHSPGLWGVNADPGQIEQVIVNLAMNAREAMPGGGRLTIEMANVVLDESFRPPHENFAPGPYVLLAVGDTGAGMDEETQARIFEPFFTTKEMGQGLGLSTVYGIVRQSGGHILVHSEPGRGTTFKVYLPRAEEAWKPAGGELSGGRETILLAEDEEPVREQARDILLSRGYTVLEARNAAEAHRLNRESEAPIHLLLTGMAMPGGGGKELAERVVFRRPGTKVLYLSGHEKTGPARQEASGKEGAILRKPFTAETLVRKVREVLDAA